MIDLNDLTDSNIDKILEDLEYHYKGYTVSELVSLIMELKHNESQDLQDLVTDWQNLCNGNLNSFFERE